MQIEVQLSAVIDGLAITSLASPTVYVYEESTNELSKGSTQEIVKSKLSSE